MADACGACSTVAVCGALFYFYRERSKYKPERWHLPHEVELRYGVDSWRIRESPSFFSKGIGLLKPGDEFLVTACMGDWLQVDLGRDGVGWVDSRLRHKSGVAPQIITPVTNLLALETAEAELSASPSKAKGLHNGQQTSEGLLAELKQCRTLAMSSKSPVEKVEANLKLEEIIAKLDILGISQDEIDLIEHISEKDHIGQRSVGDELARQKSYAHADFANPHAESCWLSTFFQSLWHSRVFHTIFEAQISVLPRAPRGTALGALQETWDLYKEAGTKVVPVNALVKAWGSGYGDCAEAMGKMQDAADLKLLADAAALVPVPWKGRAPTIKQLWNLVLGMGVTDRAIVALDFVFPPLSDPSMQRLARALKPSESADTDADLGPNFKLVAMICYMEDFRHYVVFCRCLSERGTWIFFNDLPTLTQSPKAHRRFNSWENVARACGRYGCCPRMLLYENSVAGQALLEKQHGPISDTHPATHPTVSPRSPRRKRRSGCRQM